MNIVSSINRSFVNSTSRFWLIFCRQFTFIFGIASFKSNPNPNQKNFHLCYFLLLDGNLPNEKAQYEFDIFLIKLEHYVSEIIIVRKNDAITTFWESLAIQTSLIDWKMVSYYQRSTGTNRLVSLSALTSVVMFELFFRITQTEDCIVFLQKIITKKKQISRHGSELLKVLNFYLANIHTRANWDNAQDTSGRLINTAFIKQHNIVLCMCYFKQPFLFHANFALWEFACLKIQKFERNRGTQKLTIPDWSLDLFWIMVSDDSSLWPCVILLWIRYATVQIVIIRRLQIPLVN